MACTSESELLLRSRELRVTRQRLAVLSVLRHSNQHITASEVFDVARRDTPELNASTVYRTLTQLRDLGLVSQTDLGGGERSYSWRSEQPHHHLVCTSCGALSELPHDFLDSFAEQIQSEFGFEADPDHWAVYGRCRSCASADSIEPNQAIELVESVKPVEPVEQRA